jgi:gluconate 5-dehydrogenase
MQLPDFSCKGRVALVTGSARGIGLAMARTLAAAGAAVVIHDIEIDLAAAEAAAINAQGGRAIALGGDVTDLAVADELAARTKQALGDTDILINNASIQRHTPFLEATPEDMTRQLNANVLFVTRLTQCVVPAMEQKRWGRIINLGSIQGRNGNASMPAYAMSKAAMENLTRALGRHLATSNITVNCVAPGWFNTYRNRDHLKDQATIDEGGKHVPLGRIGRPEDCNGVALLLCSAAGDYITGQTIRVDGGMSA